MKPAADWRKSLMKLISVVLCVALIMSLSFAVAEDFSLHSGITFGMTRDEVRSIEQSKGYTVKNEELKYTYYDKSGKYMYATSTGLRIDGSMAGLSDSTLYYYFDNSGKLFASVYDFNGEIENPKNYVSHFMNNYVTIQDQLEKKYGNIWYEYDWDSDSPIPRIVDYWTSTLDVLSHKARASKIELRYIVNEDGSQIHINHVLAYTYIDGYDDLDLLEATGKHFLEYRLIPAEEIDSISNAISDKINKEEQERQERNEKNNQQLNDDL